MNDSEANDFPRIKERNIRSLDSFLGNWRKARQTYRSWNCKWPDWWPSWSSTTSERSKPPIRSSRSGGYSSSTCAGGSLKSQYSKISLAEWSSGPFICSRTTRHGIPLWCIRKGSTLLLAFWKWTRRKATRINVAFLSASRLPWAAVRASIFKSINAKRSVPFNLWGSKQSGFPNR